MMTEQIVPAAGQTWRNIATGARFRIDFVIRGAHLGSTEVDWKADPLLIQDGHTSVAHRASELFRDFELVLGA
jgi:hypothetical protein